jgi:hypothetical protein
MEHSSTVPTPPAAWLLLLRCQDKWLVQGVYDTPDDPELLREQASCLEYGNELRIVRDDPSLAVLHHGLWIHTPASLNARDNWFLRYQSQLAPYLFDPRVAQVFTFSTGKLLDPRSTFKSIPGGPCPLPQGATWPVCGFCDSKMVLVGVLDFRQFDAVKMPRGSLVLHGCPECGLCANRETWSVHWLLAEEPLEIHGDLNVNVELGTPWLVSEYPTPEFAVLDKIFRTGGSSPAESAPYLNFACPTDKVGGHANWIQGEDDFRAEYPNATYLYIGQMTGEDESLRRWDSPIVYLMYSPDTGETIASLQSF